MYIGNLGIVQAGRKPASICVVNGGKISGRIKDRRPIAPIDIKIGHYTVKNAFAMFDTGASETVFFLPDGCRKIGEDPYDTGYIRGVDEELKDIYYYDASLKLPNNITVDVGLIDVRESDFDIADIIIGMDIICMGKLIIDGKNKSFSFEI